MKLTLVGTSLLVLGLAGRTEATNFAVITAPPTLLNLGVLVLSLAALVIGVQLLGAVRGGMLSRPWQIMVGGFALLALSQIATLLQTFEIVLMPAWVAPSIMVLWAGVFFYGLFETKRTLA
jgi:hypothetical protein